MAVSAVSAMTAYGSLFAPETPDQFSREMLRLGSAAAIPRHEHLPTATQRRDRVSGNLGECRCVER